jgi:multidrug efflux pump subunit AcrA (membrane-fusion protein)
MKKGGNWLYIILGIIIILAAYYFGNIWWNRDVVSIKTAVVTRGTIEAVVSSSGIVDAPVYELGTKMGGKIESLNVNEGESVKKGDLLAKFDNYEQASNDFDRTKQLFDEGAASKQSLDAARTIFEASRIIAPNHGIVAKINYREGETVVPGQPVIIVVNYDESWVEAQIDEIDIANVKIGDKVNITSDVYPDKIYDGQIYWIAPLAELRKVGGRVKMDEESYVFPCKIKFLGGHEELKVNMSVNVDVATKRSDNALLVPREAIVSKDDSSYVFKITNNHVKETKIEIGIRSYSSVEALSGLTEGDLVAVSNSSKLKDKGRIKIER